MSRFILADVLRRFLPQPKIESKPTSVPGPIAVVVKEEIEQEDILADLIWTDLIKEPRTKDRGKAKGRRPWKNCRGICLHQTAVDFGTDPNRLLNVPVHGATLKDGQIVLLHEPTDYMWHANGLNKFDIGIEVSCRAAGILGDERTFWLSKREKQADKKYLNLVKEATEIQLEATKELCMFYIKQVEENGGKIEFIHAHRQSARKPSDPGFRIWQKVAIPIMNEFGLTCGPVGWKIGPGTPIPEAWDPVNGKGVPYSWRVKGFKNNT